nr:MAG TPA: hypothetical protein [Caudoviricetes sp.]
MVLCYVVISFYCLCRLYIQVLRLLHRQKQMSKLVPLLQTSLSTYICHR